MKQPCRQLGCDQRRRGSKKVLQPPTPSNKAGWCRKLQFSDSKIIIKNISNFHFKSS